MADRYRKVRKALRVFKAHVKNIEPTSENRSERRRRFYSEDSQKLVEKIKEAKRNA